MNTLNDDTLIHIISFLDVQSLARVACASRDLNRLANDQLIWKALIKRCFPEHPYTPTGLGAKHDFKVIRAEAASKKAANAVSSSPWPTYQPPLLFGNRCRRNGGSKSLLRLLQLRL